MKAAGLFVAVTLLAALLTVLAPARANAADLPPSILEGGYIISDAAFFDGDAMTASEIQTFLNGKVKTCSTGYTCLKSYKADIGAKAADKYCAALAAAKGVSAATIIQRVALACGISPKVLLVMLQKEQGLVTATAPSSTKYGKAMGQACPDTAACDPKFAGFFNQVFGAARQMQVYTHNPSAYNYKPGQVNTIKWHPSSACGTSKVYIQNRATANLYIYTPYRPNVAALAAGTGTGDSCSSYGNRNFYNYYVSWFAPGASASAGAPAQVSACQAPPDGDIAAGAGSAIVNTASLNVRSAPTLACTAGLSTLHKGDTVTITGAYGMWTRATVGGKTVWLASRYLDSASTGAPAGTGSPCAVPATPSIAAAAGTVVTTAALNARLAPSTACETGVVVLAKDQAVPRTGTYGEWVRVTVSGRAYWVHGDFVKAQPAVKPAPAPTPAPTSMVTTTAVNLRATASTSGKVVVVLKKGTKVSVTSSSGVWRKATASGRTGWIHSSYLKAAVASTSTTKTTTAALNLRATASTSGKVVIVLKKGTKVSVTASSGVWRKVTASGKTGWVHSAYLK